MRAFLLMFLLFSSSMSPSWAAIYQFPVNLNNVSRAVVSVGEGLVFTADGEIVMISRKGSATSGDQEPQGLTNWYKLTTRDDRPLDCSGLLHEDAVRAAFGYIQNKFLAGGRFLETCIPTGKGFTCFYQRK